MFLNAYGRMPPAARAAYEAAFRNLPTHAPILGLPRNPTDSTSFDVDESDSKQVDLLTNGLVARVGVQLNDIPENATVDDLHRARNEHRAAITAITNAALAGKVPADHARIAQERLGWIVNRLDAHITIAKEGRPARAAAGSNSDFRDANGQPVVALGREHVGQIAATMGRYGTAEMSLADFVRGVAGLRTTDAVRNALSVGTDSAGGYTVPAIVFPQFIEALIPASSVLQAGARVLPLDASAKSFRFARVATVPTAAWRTEGGNVAQSDPAFAALDLTPQSLAFYFKVSRELLSDSANIDSILPSVIAQSFAKEIDRAALRGSGTPPEIRGLLNTSGIGAVTNGAAGTSLATIKWSNLTTAYQAVLDANGPAPTAAIMAPRTLVGFAGLADSTGQPLRRPTLLDPMQFIATAQIPTNLSVGASTDCSEMYVGDFREFVIGMRENVTFIRANELHAGTGEVGFYCFARVDVGCVHPASFVKVTGIRP